MPSVDIIEFGVEDIVRSGLCKEYLLAKLELEFMNFTHHNFLGDIELEKKETPGCRLYQLPDGSGFLLLHQLLLFIIVIFLLSGERK